MAESRDFGIGIRPTTRVTRGANLRSKVKVTGNENVKIVFHASLCQKSIDFCQTKTKMITGPFYTLSSNIFHQSRYLVFAIICNLQLSGRAARQINKRLKRLCYLSKNKAPIANTK